MLGHYYREMFLDAFSSTILLYHLLLYIYRSDSYPALHVSLPSLPQGMQARVTTRNSQM